MGKNSILWKPTARQKFALARPEFEILFGGARGGGKSSASIAWLLYDKEVPDYRALVIRRNSDDLKDWIDRANQLYSFFNAKCIGNPPHFKFPSGAIIRTGHLKDDNAYTKYQGHEYHKMVIEELTHIASEENYLKLISSCRTSNPNLVPQIFCTTNPNGIGRAWVKNRWQIDDKPNRSIIVTDKISGRKRIFVPSLIDDNPYLMLSDPAYVKYLESLPEDLKNQWRFGSWEEQEIKGAYYFKLIAYIEGKGHVTKIGYDPNLPVDTYWDLGVNDMNVIWVCQTLGKEIRLINCYADNDKGLSHYVKYLKVLKYQYGYEYGTHYFPHDMAVKDYGSGQTREERLLDLGVSNYDILKKMPIHDGVECVRSILPYCYFDETLCAEGLHALKTYRKEWNDETMVYKNKAEHDWASHYADAFRYLAVDLAEKFKISSSDDVKAKNNILTGNNTVNKIRKGIY